MNPKVSVIIPTFKRSQTIDRAVDSVLKQTYDNFEVIVVDDNGVGTDEGEKTAHVMNRYSEDNRVVYIRHDKNKNGSAARNTGLGIASGEYIAFLDDDDEFCPERLYYMVNKMESLSDEWGSCYSGYVKHMQNGKDQYSNEKNEGDLFKQALMRALYIGSGSNLFFRKKTIDSIGLFDVAFKRNQDLEYLVRVLQRYKMAYVDKCLFEVNYDIRTYKSSEADMIEREQYFREKFKPFLQLLSEDEQREVLIMYSIDVCREYLIRKKFVKAIKELINNKVPLIVLWKYFLYIIDRKKNNTCYGFVVKTK